MESFIDITPRGIAHYNGVFPEPDDDEDEEMTHDFRDIRDIIAEHEKRRGAMKSGVRRHDPVLLYRKFKVAHVEEGSFAEACANVNNLPELVDAVSMPEADPDDLAAWNLTPAEWRKQIGIALMVRLKRKGESAGFRPDIMTVTLQLRAALRWALSQLPEPKSAMSDESELSDYDENYHQAEAAIAEVVWE